MTKLYGPIALTAGVISSQNVDASAGWVYIENDSLFTDLGVSFQPNNPGPVTVFGGSNAWAGVVRAGGAKTFHPPSWPGFTGVVWLFPLNVATSSAVTGTFSSYSRAYITTGNTQEQPPDSLPIVRGLDITSQPRVISIPMTPFFAFSSHAVALNNNTDFGIFPDVIASLDPAVDVGCVVYIYYAQIVSQGANGVANFSVRLRFKDINTFAILGTADVLFGTSSYATPVANSFIVSPWIFAPSAPYAIRLVRGSTLPQNTGIVEIDFRCLAVAPANWPVEAVLMADSDKNSNSGTQPIGVPGIGGGVNAGAFPPTPKF